MNKLRFSLGKCHITTVASDFLDKNNKTPIELITRHVTGDWGDIEEEDKQSNEEAVKEGYRILSAYLLGNEKIYIITEHDRSLTTVMLASEY